MNVGTAVGYLDLNISKYSSALRVAQTQLGSFSDSTQSTGDRMQGLGSALTTVGSTMTKSFTVPILAAGVATGKMAIDTQQSMAQVNSILQLGGKEFKTYENTLKVGAKEIGLAYSDYAEASYQAISAGVKQTEVVGFLDKANKLAKGGLTDLTTATDLLTTVQNAYGESAGSVEDISNILIQTQNKGKTTVAELGASMGKVIPTANGLGVGIDQLGASYAIMTSKGISTAESTTYINSMFNELGKSGTEVDGVLKKVAGGSFKELMEEGKTVGDVLGILDKHAKDSGLSLTDLFGSAEAGKAALNLLSGGVDGFNGMVETMTSDTEACNKAFETMNNTAKEKLTQGLESLKNGLSDVGVAMLPLASKIGELMSSFGNWISTMAQVNPEMTSLVVSVGLLVAAIGPLLMVIGNVITAFGSALKGFGLLKAGMIALKGVIQSQLTGALVSLNLVIHTTILPAFATFGAFLTGTIIPALTATAFTIGAVTFPVWAVIAAIVALIAIGVLLVQNWDTVKAKALELGTYISECWNMLVEWTSQTWDNIQVAITNVWNSIVQAVAPFVDAIKNAIQVAWDYISGITSSIWESIRGILQSVWEFIKSIIELNIAVIKLAITTAWNAIKTITTTIWNAIKSVIEGVWNFLKPFVTAATSAIKSAITSAWNAISSVTSSIWNTIKSVITSAWDGIKSVCTSVSNAVKSVVSSAWNAIQSTTSSIWNAIKSVINTVWNGIKSVVQAGANAVKSVVSSVFNTLENIMTAPFRAAQSVISGILGGITSAINSVTSAISKVTGIFKFSPMPSEEEEPKAYSDVDYSKTRFNYAKAKQTTISDVVATNASMVEGFKGFARNINLNKDAGQLESSGNKASTVIINNTYNSPKPSSIRDLKRQDDIQMRRLAMKLKF